MCTPEPKCMRPGRITSNGYLNFLREYRKKKCGLSAVETVRCGAKVWNRLTCAQKEKYRKMGIKPRRRKCAPKRRKRPRCARRSRPRRRSGCARKRRRSSCARKRRRSSCGRKRRKSSCAPRPRRKSACRRKARPRRRPCRRPMKKKKCMRPGPVTNNGYLNFLRWFRQCNCGLSATQVVRRGARKWCSLSKEEKDKFNRMACKMSKSKRKRNSALCKKC